MSLQLRSTRHSAIIQPWLRKVRSFMYFRALPFSWFSLLDPDLIDCGDKPAANVVSISYHLNPDIHEDDITPAIQRQCTEFGKVSLRFPFLPPLPTLTETTYKLALAGMTIVVSSGDGGVAYSQSEGCLVANGTLVFGNPPNSSFVAQFPASCPYVTAVGATQVTAGNSVRLLPFLALLLYSALLRPQVNDPETATTAFPSGGGFSNTFAMPAFQQAAVNTYLTSFAPPYAPSVFNRTGRAYPDVAANGLVLFLPRLSPVSSLPLFQHALPISVSAFPYD